MPKLSDLQSLLLSHASRQASGSLYPLPDTIEDRRRTTRPIAALVRGGLVEEHEALQREDIYRTDGDLTFGLYLTASGAAAIGVELDKIESGQAGAYPAAEAAAASGCGPSKIAHVIELLRGEDGASIADMIEATGWLPHTTRAALTGLRKKGHQIEKTRSDNVTCYYVKGWCTDRRALRTFRKNQICGVSAGIRRSGSASSLWGIALLIDSPIERA